MGSAGQIGFEMRTVWQIQPKVRTTVGFILPLFHSEVEQAINRQSRVYLGG